MTKLKLLNRRYAIITISIIVIGVTILALSHAATPSIVINPENGDLGSRTNLVSDETASGTKAVKFKTCPYIAPVLADKGGGMTYVNYWFNTPDLYEMIVEVDLLNSPSSTSNHYIQMDDADIGAKGQYYGIQTTGRVLWSQWNTTDKSNLRPASGTSALGSVELGADFISLRREYGSLPSGHYKTRITRLEFDGIGDWFGYYVTFPGRSEDHVGDIRFPRKTVGVPASINDGGGQWNEFWGNNGSNLLPVPLLQINVKATANGTLTPNHAYAHYSAMPNSDMYILGAPKGYVHHEIGGTTGRCHPGDVNGNLTLWEVDCLSVSRYNLDICLITNNLMMLTK